VAEKGAQRGGERRVKAGWKRGTGQPGDCGWYSCCWSENKLTISRWVFVTSRETLRTRE